MLNALENAMSWVRRMKLYLTLGSALAAALAIAVVKITEQLLIALAQAGNSFSERLIQNEIVALAVFTGIGYAIWSTTSKDPVKFDVPVAVGSFAVGIIAVSVLFWLLPAFAHTLAVVAISPLLNLLAAFLKGEVAVSVALFAKILFFIYLLSFAVDALIEHYVNRRDVTSATERMVQKYWKELLDVLHDLYEVAIFLPRILWERKRPPSD